MSIDQKFLPAGPKMIDYVAKTEPWAEYVMEDGSVLRVRAVVTKIVDTGQLAPDGMPLYQIQMAQLMDVTWSENTKAEAAARQRSCGNE